MVKSGRGGAVKKAPPGYYTSAQAQEIMGVTHSQFQVARDRGEIVPVIPPLRTEGYYEQAAILRLASRIILFNLQHAIPTQFPVVVRQATVDDVEGIYDVIASLWGEEVATPVATRKSWYRVNDRMDYVVKCGALVLGYISIAPYVPEVLEKLMSGAMRGWDVRPSDLLPFVPGSTYDVFTGIAVRQDVPLHQEYANRLIKGFLRYLNKMAQEGIVIHRMYATSDQPEGIKISQDLGFVRQEEVPGDLFGRFVLDLETSETLLIKKYREAVLAGPAASPAPIEATVEISSRWLCACGRTLQAVLQSEDRTVACRCGREYVVSWSWVSHLPEVLVEQKKLPKKRTGS